MKIKFEKVTGAHVDTIFKWLAEPFVQEFWDNTQGHKKVLDITFSDSKQSALVG